MIVQKPYVPTTRVAYNDVGIFTIRFVLIPTDLFTRKQRKAINVLFAYCVILHIYVHYRNVPRST